MAEGQVRYRCPLDDSSPGCNVPWMIWMNAPWLICPDPECQWRTVMPLGHLTANKMSLNTSLYCTSSPVQGSSFSVGQPTVTYPKQCQYHPIDFSAPSVHGSLKMFKINIFLMIWNLCSKKDHWKIVAYFGQHSKTQMSGILERMISGCHCKDTIPKIWNKYS